MIFIDSVKKKIEKLKSKRSLHDYGFQIKTFDLKQEGKIEYAQWLHPYEQPKLITQSMVNFFRHYSKSGGLAIDIGAHTGDTTIPMALAIGPKGTVLALEPNPHVFKILQKNSELNKSKINIVPLCFAATDHDGEFEFNYSDASYCNGGFFQSIKNQKHGHNHVLKVKGKNPEVFFRSEYGKLLPELSLIKIDTEGYDKEIIKSLKPLLMAYKPNIISECNKNLTPEERSELYDILASLNYSIQKLEGFNEETKPTCINNHSEMMNWQHFDLVATPK
ncbi:MAG: FkbM family methyltransferase [Bacteroidales bacterium]|nr:FkbM family methyltransferase [Bacteroidales bacterium]